MATLFLSSPASAAPQTADNICVKVYLHDVGWQDQQCGAAGNAVTAGSPGAGHQVEAMTATVTGSSLCLMANMQGSGWDPSWSCAGDGQSVTIGKAGQGLRLEAVQFGVQSGVICGNSFVTGVGWNPNWYCGVDGGTNSIGTTGQDQPMEAVGFEICRPEGC
ncbi:hypothetical protein OG943_25585 [Amycolatopsis sp. NBC_00345]|uniref:hypothetical protein n=1 Tax=Amycolatopsis sp. NBC_00345 TaxID=2975955 RepID=UPI002E272264